MHWKHREKMYCTWRGPLSLISLVENVPIMTEYTAMLLLMILFKNLITKQFLSSSHWLPARESACWRKPIFSPLRCHWNYYMLTYLTCCNHDVEVGMSLKTSSWASTLVVCHKRRGFIQGWFVLETNAWPIQGPWTSVCLASALLTLLPLPLFGHYNS